MKHPFFDRSLSLAIVLLWITGLAGAQTRIKPGFNLFSPEQDVQLGREAAQEIEKEVEVVDDGRLTSYVSKIGERLAAVAPGAKYPYAFKVVADPSINAFALPGGPIYIHTGLITAADNEAQVAGVVAHEVAHVALRHSTNQASKAQAFQIPLVLAGGLFGDKGGLLPALAEAGIGFGLNSVFMKYSRDAEKQADLLGAQMMSEVGYDPVEMARFFEKLESGGGARMPQFFSDHPNPGNRVRYVQDEVQQLPRRTYSKNLTGDFDSMKQRAQKIQPKKKAEASPPANEGQPQPSAAQLERFRGAGYEVSYPAGWQAYQLNEGTGVTIAPSDGVVQLRNGERALATGLMAGYFEPKQRGLRGATNQLISELQASNPELRPVSGKREAVSVSGRKGQSVLLEGPSPLKSRRELVWLVTTEDSDQFFYLLLVSPDNRYNDLRPQYQEIIQSIRFN